MQDIIYLHFIIIVIIIFIVLIIFFRSFTVLKLLVDVDDDDDDDAEGDNDAETIDAAGDCLKGTTTGGIDGCCSSTARARRSTLAICSCSSRFK